MKNFFLYLIVLSIFISGKALAQISGPTVVCPSTTVNYQVTVGDGIGVGIYKWYLNGVWNKTFGNTFSANILIPASGSSHTISVEYLPTFGATETYYLYANSYAVGTASSGYSIVCAGTNVTVQLNNYVGSDLVWQRKDGNGAWYNVDQGFGFNPNLNASNLTQTTYFQAVLNSGSCGTLVSNMITIDVYSYLGPGTINGEQTICYNTSAAVLNNVSPATGSTGSYTYQWQYFNGSSWINISGANGESYHPGVLTTTTQYRRLVSTACQSQPSNTITVTVYPPVSGGSISSYPQVCSGSAAPSFSSGAATGGNYSYAYQWQYSSDNSNWYTAPGISTEATYSPPVQTTHYYYRRRVVSCGQEAYSNTYSIAVYSPLTPGSISNYTTSVCQGTAAPSFVSNNDASGSNESYYYQWEQSVDNNNWSNASGINYTPIYTPPAQTITTHYRRKVSACNEASYSNTVTISVFATVTGGAIANSTLSICPASTPAAFTSPAGPSLGDGSYSYQWEQSGNNVNWTNASGSSTSATYAPMALSNTTYFRRRVSSCGQIAYSNTATIQVYSPLQAGSIANTTPTVCSGTAPAIISNTADASGSNGSYTYQWQQSADGTNWVNAQGSSTSSTYTPPALTNAMHYRRSVTACGQLTFTNTILIGIHAPLTGGSIDNSVKIICSGITPASFTNQASPTGGNGYSYLWEQSVDGINFLAATGDNTALTYSPPVLNSPIHYRRGVNSCGNTVYSNVEFINVTPNTVAGVVNSGQETYGTAAGNLTLVDFTGVVQKWQQKIGSGSWTDIANTTTTQPYTNISDIRYYRAIVKSGVCAEAPSSEASIIVHPIPVISFAGPTAIPPAGSTQLSTTGGWHSYQWYRNNVAINGATTATVVVTTPGDYEVMVHATPTSGTYTTEEVAVKNSLEAPLQDINYVRTITYAKAGLNETTDLYTLAPADYTISTNYFDGLGRPIQSVTLGAGANGLDLIQPVAYDAFGREAIKYLPYVHEARDGRYQPTALAAQSVYYATADKTAHDIAPFSETIFEPSPLNRVVKQGEPGLAWQPDEYQTYASQDHTVKFAYELNGANEVLLWTYTYPTATYPLGSVNAGTSNTVRFYYPANQLYKNKTKDEQQNEVIEYIDKQGRVVLKRVQAVTGSVTINDVNYASTYYIYDDFGQLVCVIPPEATKQITQTSPVSEYFGKTVSVKEGFIARWCFRYTYDARRRMSQKQVPGAGAVFMVYDKRDRLVMTQDGNQRTPRRWLFTKYDALNRPVLTGIHTADSALVQSKMQRRVDLYYAAVPGNNGAWFETYGPANPVHGYDNRSYPPESTSNNYLTVIYYDNYDFRNQWNGNYAYVNEGLSAEVDGTNYVQNTTEFLRVKGQVTGTKTKVLDEGITGGVTWLKAINYYDEKYHTIQSVSDNYKAGQDRVSNVYDFSGKLLKSKASHSTMNVTWKDRVKVSVTGNKLQSGADVSGWGTSGAASMQQLAAGQDGWLEVTATETSRSRMIGLSDQNTNAHYASIDYAFYMNTNSLLSIYESGTTKGNISGGYVSGDVLKIERVGTAIKYYKNGVLVYSSATPSSTLLMVDAAFTSASSTLASVRSSFSVTTKSTTRYFEYDHAGRLINTWHKVNNGDSVLIAHNEYNELGQLIDKKLHSSAADASDAKQSVDYRYNIRGWLESINNAQLTVDNANDDTGDYFGMQLAYNTDLGTGNASHLQYNGNISATKWSNHYGLSGIKENAYNYTYDAMNRLKTADFKQKAGSTWGLAQYRDTNGTMQSVNAFSEHISEYDLNGNIRFLQRRGQDGQLIDDLTYSYGATAAVQSNKLMRVTDAAIDTEGFKEVNTTVDDYTYDANGNLVRDRNRDSEELLKNGSFDNGNEHWIASDPEGRLTFSEGRINIASGTTLSTVVQSGILLPSTVYLVTIDMVRTEGTGIVQIRMGNSGPSNLTTSTVLFLTSSTGTDIKFEAQAGFVGYINSVSVANISTISYNFLNLPEIVKLNNGSIRYIYTATGQKVTQVVSDKGITKQTDYIGEYIYQNDTLQFINHEEGRVVMTGVDPEYQYHLKDIWNNTRITFTTKNETEAATATMEDSNATTEQSHFLYYDEAVKINSTLFDHTNNGATQYSTRLSGSPNEQTGLAKSISVMPGDTIRTEVYAKYLDGNTSNWTTALTDLMAAIAGGTAPAGTFVDGGAAGSTGGTTPSFIGLLDKGNETGDSPKAYLNYLIFDKNYVLLNGGFVRMSENAREYGQDGAHEKLAAEFVITEPGYVYIYLSNDNAALGGSTIEVYFDDFQVEHSKSPVIQTDDYTPFGITFNSFKRESSVENRVKFQGQERITELGLGWDAFKYRNYMPEIGRFFNIDPLAEEYEYNSPYAFAENKVGRGVELEGLELGPFLMFARPTPVVRPAIRPVVETMVKTSGSGRTTGQGLQNAARVGRQTHGEELPKWQSEGYQTEVKVGEGNRVDGIKIEPNKDGTSTGFIRELKPNTPSGRRAGIKQLERYVDAASKENPEVTEWQPELTLYQLLAPTTGANGSSDTSSSNTGSNSSQSDQGKTSDPLKPAPIKSDATRVAPVIDRTKVKTPCVWPCV